MYKVVLLAKENYEINSIEVKGLEPAAQIFECWLKEDAFDGETMLLWDNDNLMKQINVRKKTDWRNGEAFHDVNDINFSRDARKYFRKIMCNN